MIQSKKDLHFYLCEDKKRNLGSYKLGLLRYVYDRIFLTDGMMAYLYLKSLRKYEYAINCLSRYGLYGKLVKGYYGFIKHRRGVRFNIMIGPNMVGYGFRIPHVIGGGVRN